ncbi:MAG: sulfotransferase domain-containing protein [Flammeovirgaceae bacterium]
MKTFSPNIFIIGVAKCGTTTLHNHLDSFSEVCMSNPKEPFFFECEYEKGLDYYQKTYFSHWNQEQLIGESRHRNMYLPYIPQRILETNPQAKLIAILREPASRAYSHWWHLYSRGLEKLSFKKAIEEDLKRIEAGKRFHNQEEVDAYCACPDNVQFYRTYVDSGYYYEQLMRYYQIFENEQIKVLFLEDLKHNPAAVLNELRLFIGLPALQREEIELKNDNTKKLVEVPSLLSTLGKFTGLKYILPNSWRLAIAQRVRKKLTANQQADPHTIAMLKKHFQAHNQKLSTLLNKDLSHWND